MLDARDGSTLQHTEEAQTNELHRAAGRFLLFRLVDVPAHGAVRVDVVAGEGSTAAAHDDPGSTVLENEFLRVRVDLRHAWISSVTDKRTGRELVRQDATLGLNGYVYDEYATAGGFNHQSSKTTANESMHLLASRTAAPPPRWWTASVTPPVRRWSTNARRPERSCCGFAYTSRTGRPASIWRTGS